MDYKELKQIFQDLKQKSPDENLTAHVIFQRAVSPYRIRY